MKQKSITRYKQPRTCHFEKISVQFRFKFSKVRNVHHLQWWLVPQGRCCLDKGSIAKIIEFVFGSTRSFWLFYLRE